jgi:peptide-methionine (S)-S-oxide reductase
MFRQILAAVILTTLIAPAVFCAEINTALPMPAVDNPKTAGPLQTAVMAGGCFWGVQGVFEHMRGVKKVLSGYSGGEKSTAEYEIVSTGRTGHAESVQIVFDPNEVSYGELLRVYFSVAHDPTQLNRQGPDVGTQYRSNIFFSDESQKKIAMAYISQLDKSGVFKRPIVTRVDPLKGFYPAEKYHQDFLIKNPNWPYIVVNDIPKIQSMKKVFPVYYQGQPVTVDGK